MPDVKRTVRIVTTQTVDASKPPIQEGFPMRNWSIEIFLVNENDGSMMPANVYDKATYKLHPSFGPKETQVFKKPPFRCAEEGWGEFDMKITLTAMNKGGEHILDHDLNFAQERYENSQKVTFKNPKPDLLALLRESGPVPGDENGAKAAGAAKGADAKKKRPTKNVDMEKLADGLQKLDEDNLLNVVQLIHDQKTSDTYTKNDVENGEFHVDLYTLPDTLVKNLWDLCTEKGVL